MLTTLLITPILGVIGVILTKNELRKKQISLSASLFTF